MTMTETEELISRRDALKAALADARSQVAKREEERVSALSDLEERRVFLVREVAMLQERLDALSEALIVVDDEWRTATREAAGAMAHLSEVNRE